MASIEDEGTQLVGVPDEQGPQSPFETLRAKRDEVASRQDVLIPLGSAYEEMGVHAKYRLLGRDEANQIAKNVRKQTKDQSEFMFRVLLDSMIRACEGFYLKPAGVSDEEAEPLRSPDSSEEVKTYAQFAKHLNGGQELESHRKAVVYVFGDNEFAVGQHGLLLNRWFANTDLDVDLEALEG